MDNSIPFAERCECRPNRDQLSDVINSTNEMNSQMISHSAVDEKRMRRALSDNFDAANNSGWSAQNNLKAFDAELQALQNLSKSLEKNENKNDEMAKNEIKTIKNDKDTTTTIIGDVSFFK